MASSSQSCVDMPSFGLVGFRGRLARTSSILAKVLAVILMLKFLSWTASGELDATDELPRLMIASIFFSSSLVRVEDSGVLAAGLRGGDETAILVTC